MVKRIYEIFDDKEFEILLEAKLKARLTWHDFIMLLADESALERKVKKW